MSDAMKLTVNGSDISTRAQTVSELLSELGYADDRIAVERNGKIVPRAEYSVHGVSEGDGINIVHFVGGG